MEFVRKFGPYLAVELLLPGGTLIAIALYLCRRKKMVDPMSIARLAARLLA
jgi:hypothetical protein